MRCGKTPGALSLVRLMGGSVDPEKGKQMPQLLRNGPKVKAPQAAESEADCSFVCRVATEHHALLPGSGDIQRCSNSLLS